MTTDNNSPAKNNSRAGIPNKNKKFLLARLQDEYGENFHPIMRMAENAHKLQDLIDKLPEDDLEKLFIGYKSAIDAWEKIAQYTEPKLKAVEVKHTSMPKVKMIDLSGKPRIEDSVIDVELPDAADDTDRE